MGAVNHLLAKQSVGMAWLRGVVQLDPGRAAAWILVAERVAVCCTLVFCAVCTAGSQLPAVVVGLNDESTRLIA